MIVEKEVMNDARHNCQKRHDENGDQRNHPRIHWNNLGFQISVYIIVYNTALDSTF